MTFAPDLIFVGCNVATMRAGDGYGEVHDAAVCVKNGRITWIGNSADQPRSGAEAVRLDLEGRWVTPGLIDCHTHVVFGGNRSSEFEKRLEGQSYAQIAASGGGIVSTVRATQGATPEALIQSALRRVSSMIGNGVTTIEVKSGYGLDLDGELKMLRVARRLGELGSVRVVTTFLGLHALPETYRGRADEYVDYVINAVLPAVCAERLADAVDAYVEPLAFTPEQAARFFEAASELGIRPKVHAEQLSRSGGTRLAADTHALSADHIEYANELDVRALAAAGTVAVLLPGAFVALRETQPPPIDDLRRHNVPFAIATDCNPGTSPMTSLLLAMNLACTIFRLTPAEALRGVTRHAAKALGLEDDRGTVDVGKAADLAVWDIDHPAELSYWMGHSSLHSRYLGGLEV